MLNSNKVNNYKNKSSQNNQLEKPAPFWKSAGLFIIEVIKIIIISLAIIIPVRYYLIQPFYVKGASMEPTFHDYEYLIINEISYRFSEPQRGDVVVLKDPQDTSQFFIKRIIGLPEEIIEIDRGEVIIYNEENSQGIVIDEFYLSPEIVTLGEYLVTLKESEYFVLGDNRKSSFDSRNLGPISRDYIVGKVWVRAWPFNKLKYFVTPEYNI